MVGCHHQLDGHEFEHALRVGDGHGSLACCSSWVTVRQDRVTELNYSIEVLSNSSLKILPVTQHDRMR